MAGHTIVNLLEVEDAAKRSGMPPGLEARGPRRAEVLAFGAGEPGDAEMVQDFW